MSTSDLSAWDSIHTAINRRPGSELAAPTPPAGLSPDDQLAWWWAGYLRLGIDDSSLTPLADWARRYASRYSEPWRGDAYDGAMSLPTAIDSAITRTLDAGASHPDILRTRDFVETVIMTAQGQHLCCGIARSLQAGHALRSHLTCDDQMYVLDGRDQVVILGPPAVAIAGPMQPRAWYPMALAVSLTRRYRTPQAEAEADRARRDKLRAEAEQRRESATTEAQLRTLQNRIRELEEVHRG